ncbi:hypothetical protein [Mycolicibacterium neoaurum]|uniref:Uncharacterized protein n=1 Tax=Mycolicibacterium neoaurum TaxID=1795 RepID=A0AAV2WLR2_MYCNE|nr:hypothetical protein [Mycolicibacterium neoaurum]CDQ44928.1 hypothetical protein BN1047_02813 [Mycolicibacterium neoaurum]
MWQEDGESPTKMAKKQQTKTTKHTIEFSKTGIKKTNHLMWQEDGESPTKMAKKQQTKTTKHTIEFSNNTPDPDRATSPRLKAAVRSAGSEVLPG